MDGWVTVWWRRRSTREITLISLLCFSLVFLPPQDCSLIISKKLCSELFLLKLPVKIHPLFFGPLSSSVCPAGKFYLSDQTGSRSAQHSNSVPSLLRKVFFFLNQHEGEKRGTEREGDFTRLHHGLSADKELFCSVLVLEENRAWAAYSTSKKVFTTPSDIFTFYSFIKLYCWYSQLVKKSKIS